MGIKVQHFEVEGASEEGVRKRRKVLPSPKLESVEETISTYKEGAVESEARRRKLGDAQKSLHLSLKPEILKLCKIFKFSGDMEGLVEEFLEYVMNNHNVSTEATILQAFKMSLCWTVASMLKQKINRKETVALAKQQLDFDCSKEKADFVYSLLRCIKGVFSYRTGKRKVADSPSSNDQRLLSPLGLEVETKLAHDGISKSIKEIQKKFQKKLNKLIQKQQEEKNGIVCSFEEYKARIEERKRMEISVIRSCLENNASMRRDKLKLVDGSFTKEFEELENQMETRLKKLEAEQLAARKKIQEREAHWVDAVKSWARDELLGKRSSHPDDYAEEVDNISPVNVNPPSSAEQICKGLTMNVSEKDVQLEVPQTIGSNDGLEKLVSGDEPFLDEQIPDTKAVSVSGEVQVGVPETTGSSELVSGSGPLLEEQIPDTSAVIVLGEVHLIAPETIGSSDGLENLVSRDESLLEDQIPDTAAVSVSGEVQLEVPEILGFSDGLENLISDIGPLLEEQIPDTSAVTILVNEMQLRGTENVSFVAGDAIDLVTQISVAEKIPDTTTLTVQGGDDALLVQDSEENGERRIVTVNGTPGMNLQDSVDDAVNENSAFQELLQVNASSLQPAIAVINGDPGSSNQAHDECILPSVSSGMQPGAVPPCDEQNGTVEVEHSVSQPVETALSNRYDHEVMVSEPAAQEHMLLTSNSPSRSNAFDVPLVGEVSNFLGSAACTFNPAMELVMNPPLMSQPSTSSLNQSIGVPIGALGIPFPELQTFVTSEFNNCPAQNVQALPLVPPPLYPDLFLKELERLHKELYQTCKDYEDKNLHRQSECDKEIAQIRLKYEIKQQESEAEFFTQKKEFEDNHHKVSMNISLAAAFRETYMQDVNATSMQHLCQLSMQQNAHRPLQVASTPSASSPVANLQTLAPEPSLQTTAPAPIIRPRTTPSPPVQDVNAASMQHPNQLSMQQNAHRPFQVASTHSASSPVANLQTLAPEPSLQTTAPAPIIRRRTTPSPLVQDVNATFMQHLKQLSMQQNAHGPFQVASTPLASSPVANLQTLAPEPSPQTTAPAPIIRPRTKPPPLVQDVNASSMQQVNQLSMQQNAHRPFQVASTPSASSPVANLQTLAPEPNTQMMAPASINRPRTTPPPPVQDVRPPSALCPSAILRPPLINSISYSNGNLQGSAEIRARAPHLRSSATVTSLPPHPNRMSTPLMNAPAPQSSRGLPALPSIFSTLELLRSIPRPPAPSPSLVDCVPNIGQLNTSEIGTSTVAFNAVCSGGSTDVVYLSDEE